MMGHIELDAQSWMNPMMKCTYCINMNNSNKL